MGQKNAIKIFIHNYPFIESCTSLIYTIWTLCGGVKLGKSVFLGTSASIGNFSRSPEAVTAIDILILSAPAVDANVCILNIIKQLLVHF